VIFIHQVEQTKQKRHKEYNFYHKAKYKLIIQHDPENKPFFCTQSLLDENEKKTIKLAAMLRWFKAKRCNPHRFRKPGNYVIMTS